MKNKTYIILSAAVLMAALVLAVNARGAARHPEKQQDFKGSAAYDKLDLRLKQAWEESAAPGGDPDRLIECMLKADGRPTEEQRAALSAAGFSYRTVVGTIVTGNLRARSVPEVASLPFVQVMELAVPLSIKKR